MKLHEATWSCMELHEATLSYMKLHGATWSFMKLHGATWSYMKLHEATWSYMKLHGATWSYMKPHGRTWRYMELHGATIMRTCSWCTKASKTAHRRCRSGRLPFLTKIKIYRFAATIAISKNCKNKKTTAKSIDCSLVLCTEIRAPSELAKT